MDERRKNEAIAAARRELARRLSRVCSSLSPEEFESLLDRMAGVYWKYDVLPAIPGSRVSDTGATGEYHLPTGEHQSQTGEHQTQTGEHQMSTGEHQMRTGEQKSRRSRDS
jgi:hypothetical protein